MDQRVRRILTSFLLAAITHQRRAAAAAARKKKQNKRSPRCQDGPVELRSSLLSPRTMRLRVKQTGREAERPGRAVQTGASSDTPVRSVGRSACPVGDVGHRLPLLYHLLFLLLRRGFLPPTLFISTIRLFFRVFKTRVPPAAAAAAAGSPSPRSRGSAWCTETQRHVPKLAE